MGVVDNRREQFVAIQRGRKATRIINHLDATLGQPIVRSDVSDWSHDQWAAVFTRAGEHFNSDHPEPTIEAILQRVAVRDRVRRARLARAS
jgi:hypothetical protein